MVWIMRVVGMVVSVVCAWCAMHLYVWATSSTWEWARMVSSVPMMVCMVLCVLCACVPWSAHRQG